MRRKLKAQEKVTVQTAGTHQVRPTAVVVTVVLLHAIAVGGAFFFIQGCAAPAPKPLVVEAPPPPIMPPSKAPSQMSTRTVFQPPVPVEPAPAMLEPGSGATHVIAKGESLSGIAKRYGVSWRELAEINGIKDPNKVRAGQKLVLPSHAASSGAAAAPSAARASAAAASGSDYVVQPGDSLSKIAKRLGVATRDLAAANNISDPNRIRVGQKLNVPGGTSSSAAASTPAPATEALLTESFSAPEPVAAPPPPEPAARPMASSLSIEEKPLDYTVLTGDTLEDIAKLFIVSKDDIMKLNNLSGEGDIKPGMKILIPPPDI